MQRNRNEGACRKDKDPKLKDITRKKDDGPSPKKTNGFSEDITVSVSGNGKNEAISVLYTTYSSESRNNTFRYNCTHT